MRARYDDIKGCMQAVVSYEGEHWVEEGEAVRLNRRHIRQCRGTGRGIGVRDMGIY